MAGATVLRRFHEAMISLIHTHPEHTEAFMALRELMEEESDYLVEHVVEPFRVLRVRSYTYWRILKERQRVNWVNSAFLQSTFFRSLKQHGPRRPPNSKLIERMYSSWRSDTPEGNAVSPVLLEKKLD